MAADEECEPATSPGKVIWRNKYGQRGLQVQLEEDGDGRTRRRWMESSGL